MLAHVHFATADAMVEFINDEPVATANIVKIIEKDGQWVLFYWIP